ncbi:hypothetical protein [Polynucleobacter brandtiae]|nr:hypothetical protein [Polynucleobacter brandtiae]
MCREDVLPLIKQLEFFDCLPKKSPKFILMDSFSELTDQLFESRRDQWLFACAYGDVSHTTEFESQFKCHGLLPVESLEKQYLALFNAFEARWGLVPILFLHFPIALEKRQLYIDRHHGIVEVIQKISKSVKNLTPIQINEVEIAWPEHVSEELKNFPYHYDVKTYEKFKVQLDGTGLFR